MRETARDDLRMRECFAHGEQRFETAIGLLRKRNPFRVRALLENCRDARNAVRVELEIAQIRAFNPHAKRAPKFWFERGE